MDPAEYCTFYGDDSIRQEPFGESTPYMDDETYGKDSASTYNSYPSRKSVGSPGSVTGERKPSEKPKPKPVWTQVDKEELTRQLLANLREKSRIDVRVKASTSSVKKIPDNGGFQDININISEEDPGQ